MILGQSIPLRIVFNTLKKGYLHHSVLLHGPDGVGKLSACVTFAKTFFCEEGFGNACNRCESCLKVHLFRHDSVHIVSNSDRMGNVAFFKALLEKGLSRHPNRINYHLVHEVAHLLYRHKMRFLDRLKREKKSYPEGVRASDKALEEDLANTYGLLNDYYNGSKPDDFFLRPDLFERLVRLQNCLDRSLLPKEGIDKAINLVRQSSSQAKRVVIIENLHGLHRDVVPKLLKILEEPPENTQFLLTLGALKDLPQGVVKPLQSRCLMLGFNRLTTALCKRILVEKFGVEATSIPSPMTPDLKSYFEGFAKNDPDLSTSLAATFTSLFEPKKPADRNATLKNLQKTMLEGSASFEHILVAIGDYLEKRLDRIPESDNHKIWHVLRLVSEVRAMLNSKAIDEKNLSMRLIVGIKNIA